MPYQGVIGNTVVGPDADKMEAHKDLLMEAMLCAVPEGVDSSINSAVEAARQDLVPPDQRRSIGGNVLQGLRIHLTDTVKRTPLVVANASGDRIWLRVEVSVEIEAEYGTILERETVQWSSWFTLQGSSATVNNWALRLQPLHVADSAVPTVMSGVSSLYSSASTLPPMSTHSRRDSADESALTVASLTELYRTVSKSVV